ncbi:hypothetical protein LGN07_21275 [Burkholderia cepacia]|uniref:hypothetical protein n=1 Tax=Burkholderia cepacia complex TaxID=87882 RepID=UPI001B8F473C|nr:MULTISPECIES: hypothetical protein [Burkholderia cepacia complex]MBR8283631.1 hypothetical protein [Burkholderia vietnamiensis]MCA8121257.1 hypothetical protein [Burkholderia cepacia]
MKAPSTNRRRKRLAIDDSPEAVAARLRAVSTQITKWANGALKVKAPSEAAYVVLAGPTRANPKWKEGKTVVHGVDVSTLSGVRVKKASTSTPAMSKARFKKAVTSVSKIK